MPPLNLSVVSTRRSRVLVALALDLEDLGAAPVAAACSAAGEGRMDRVNWSTRTCQGGASSGFSSELGRGEGEEGLMDVPRVTVCLPGCGSVSVGN